MMNIINRLFKKKVLVLWYPIDCNLGDYYIYETVKSYLEEWGYICINIDVGLPYEQIAKVACKCDFLWFAGGGLIERWIPDIILQFEKFHKISKHIKYGITGLSIGEFDYSDNKPSLSYWINNALFFFTRDKYSADELNRIIEKNGAYSSADVVFASNAEKQYLNNKISYDIGINLRDIPYPDLTGDFDWNEWSKSIDSDRRVIGIPDQYDFSNIVNFDIASEYSPQNALETISQCDIIVAMRFHVVLFAAKMGKIPIPINYCPKVGRLSEQLGIERLVLGIHDYHKLSEKINEAINNRDQYLNTITKNVYMLENDIKTVFESIGNCLKKEI